jgi:catechol 2,3-dioxygenase-like lactoylglutathione lyase family enzyme
MKIEHIAFQVPEPNAMARWYVEHLGFSVKRQSPPDAEVQGCFLADASGSVMIEIYRNDKALVPDYAAQDPLITHLAFVCDDVPGTCKRLQAAGAVLVSHSTVESGDEIAMLRDPWQFPIQLCRRAAPML